MKHNEENGPISRALGGGGFDPKGLDADLEAIRDLYRNHGYKDVAIGDPEVTSSGPDRSDPNRPSQGVRLAITIEEGDRWTLGELTVRGNRVVGDLRLIEAFERPTDPGLDLSALDAVAKALRATRLGRLNRHRPRRPVSDRKAARELPLGSGRPDPGRAGDR